MGMFSRKEVEENVIKAPRRSKTRETKEVEVTQVVEEIIEVYQGD